MADDEPGDLDPARAADLAAYIELLGRRRAEAGSPPFRALAKAVGPLLRPPRTVSFTTVSETFQPWRRRLDPDLVVGIVRALGAGAAEAERWRQAYLRIHRAARGGGPAGVLRRLPGDLATFTGRDRELAQLLAAVDSGAGTLVVSAIEGMAGVGKTQLAVRAAHQLVRAGRYAELQLCTNLRGFDADHEPADPAAVLDMFLRQLDVPAAQVPVSLDERAAMFRDRLHGRHALLLLDNAADEDQVRPLLPGSDHCLVLITSRRSLAGLDGARLHRLDVFTAEEALTLLATVIGAERVAAEPEQARAVVEAVGRLPLAVALLAARLRAHPERALAGLARRLETGETGGLDAVGGGGRALRAVFDLSFQALPDGAKAVFGAIGVHPGRDYTADAIAAVTGTTGEEADRELDRLLDEYLVRETTRGRYEVHDLVHDYAVEIAADVFPDRSAAFDRLARWYLHSAHAAALAIEAFNLPEMKPDPDVRPAVFESYDAAMAWYDAETENLRAVHQVAAASGLVDVCWRLAVCLRTFMNLRVRIEDNYGFHQRAAEVARAHGEPKTLAFMLIGMSTPAQQLDRPEEAEAVLTEALRLAEATGDLVNQGRAMMERGTMLNRLGRPAEAVPLWQDVIAIYESLGDRRSVMLSHLNLGVMQFGLGHPDLSWDEFQHALREAQAVGEPRAECIIRGNIGELLVHRGDYAQAHAHFLEHHAFAEAIGDRQQCAESLAGQGNALHGLGRVAEAEQLWTAALAMFEELNGSAQTAREVRERLERLKRSREDPAAAGATARPESG